MSDVPIPSGSLATAPDVDDTFGTDPLNYAIKVITALLQTLWESTPDGVFHWTDTLEETGIVITEDNPIMMDVVERKPIISIGMTQLQFAGMSMDDLVNVRQSDAREQHTDSITGAFTLNCISRVPKEARFIGWMCARTIWNLRKMLVVEGRFHEIGRKISMGPVSPAGALVSGDTEGAAHTFPIYVPFFLQWTDFVTPLKNDWSGRPIHKLHSLEMRLHSRLDSITKTPRPVPPQAPAWGGMMAGQGGGTSRELRAPHIKGKPINVSNQLPAQTNVTVHTTKI